MEPEKTIRKMWSSNAFMNVLKIQIKEVHCGGATLEMPIDFDIHTNHWLGVHGGAMAAPLGRHLQARTKARTQATKAAPGF